MRRYFCLFHDKVDKKIWYTGSRSFWYYESNPSPDFLDYDYALHCSAYSREAAEQAGSWAVSDGIELTIVEVECDDEILRLVWHH